MTMGCRPVSIEPCLTSRRQSFVRNNFGSLYPLLGCSTTHERDTGEAQLEAIFYMVETVSLPPVPLRHHSVELSISITTVGLAVFSPRVFRAVSRHLYPSQLRFSAVCTFRSIHSSPLSLSCQSPKYYTWKKQR